MNSFKHLLFLIFVLATAGVSAQKDSDVLFTVADKPVTVGEFKYIYSKTNGEETGYNDESVREYLDLYERFKLKVARAKAMGLDTVAALQNELEGYRRQLADNYLVDRQVTDRLVATLHQRQKKDLEFSHILLKFKGNPSPADTAALFNQAKGIKAGLTASNFAEEAKKVSQDNFSAPNGGKIGYITAPFPKGMHRLEAALYGAKTNEVVGPVRTALGYHLAIKTEERSARGETEIAHILIRKPKGTKTGTMPIPAQLQSAQKMLANGEDFAKVAARISEDGKTKDNAGYLGFIGINRYEPVFENAAFALAKDGQVSDIIESSVGFHLIRRISAKGIQPLEDVRPLLETKVKADGRFEDAKKQMLKDIRVKANVQENKAVFGRYAASLVDSTFLSFRWKPVKTGVSTPLLAVGNDYKVGLDQFQEYLRKNSRKRVSMGRSSNASTVASNLYDTWINEQLMAYAESQLENDFPEFAALMREYREGILLFEATKIEVWDKASDDTVGLKQFFEMHREDYMWEERATVTRYVVNAKSGVDINEVYAYAADHDMDETLDKFGRVNIDASSDDFEFSRLTEIGNLMPKTGSRTPVANDMRKGVATFSKVEALLPARKKELREARGYVIADYQDQLEREWVEKLRKQFPVKINKKVLAKLIKS
ncbi:MAG: peptidylprolyl isomerase [Lewinella sp.]